MNLLLAALLLAPQDDHLEGWQYRQHGWQINDGPLMWNGVLIHPTAAFGFGLRMDVDDLEFESAGTSFVLEYERKEFHSFGGGVEFDLGLLRLHVEGFGGAWKGTGTIVRGDGAEGEADLDGEIYGIHGKLWWPAVVYHGYDVDVTFGPAIGFYWIRETLTDTNVDDLGLEDDAARDTLTNETAYTIGFYATYELPIGSVKLVVEAGVEVPLFGDLTRGVTFEVLIGPKFGWTF